MKRNSTFKGIKTANLNFRSKGKKEHTALSTEDDPGSGFLVERLNKKLHNPGGLVAPLKWKFQIRQTIFLKKERTKMTIMRTSKFHTSCSSPAWH